MNIYKISKDDFCYIGATKNLKLRMRSHKSVCNNPKAKGYNIKLYQIIRSNGGWDEWKKELICDCVSAFDERYWIQRLSNINTIYPVRKEMSKSLTELVETISIFNNLIEGIDIKQVKKNLEEDYLQNCGPLPTLDGKKVEK